nr:probable polygalacturonase isoform X1 [Ipomoea batatas]
MTPDVQSRLPNVFLVLLRRQAARGRHPTGRTMDVGEGGAKSILAVQNLAQNAKAFGGTCSSSLTHSNTQLCSKSVAATLPAAKTSRSRSKFVAKSRLFQGSSTNSVFVALSRSMEVVAHNTALHTRVFVVAFVRRRLLQDYSHWEVVDPLPSYGRSIEFLITLIGYGSSYFAHVLSLALD